MWLQPPGNALLGSRAAWSVQPQAAWARCMHPAWTLAALPVYSSLLFFVQEAMDRTMDVLATEPQLAGSPAPVDGQPAGSGAAAGQAAGQAAAELQRAHARELWRASGAVPARCQASGFFRALDWHPEAAGHLAPGDLHGKMTHARLQPCLAHRPAFCGAKALSATGPRPQGDSQDGWHVVKLRASLLAAACQCFSRFFVGRA